jgi:hypothetical protein
MAQQSKTPPNIQRMVLLDDEYLGHLQVNIAELITLIELAQIVPSRQQILLWE